MTRPDHPLLDALRSGALSRRDFVRQALAAGAGLPAIASVLAACGGERPGRQADGGMPPMPATPEEEVAIYNWSDYIGETTIEDFERETGIRVVYDTYESNEDLGAKLQAAGDEEGAKVVMIAGNIEQELSLLSPEEQKEFLADLGLAEPGLNRLIRAGYALLDLITFFTVGEKETKAWTIKRGTRAPGAAGKIHTDFERGFIRAEVIAYADYLACGSEAKAKEKGLMRSEGKEYVVQDGDCILFRFNV